MVGIIGCSGAGKSTLLRLINRLIEPCEGRIWYHDEDITALSGQRLRRWRAKCAMIFQQFHLVDRLDVLTNVLIGRINEHADLPSMFKLSPRSHRLITWSGCCSGATQAHPGPAPTSSPDP
jgi:phosphonate transport system ATP-binding protein